MDEKTKPEEHLALLKEKLTRLMPAPTRFEAAIPGMMVSRFDRDTPASKCFYFPIAALIVQGYKRSMIGNQEVNYGEGYCMVVGVDMPGVYQISSVTPEKPFLSISIRLDRRIISQLITEMPSLIASDTAEQEPAVVARAGAELLEAFVRLVDLLDAPGRISVFAPMILREIHYHLLSGSQGGCLRFFSSTGTQAGQVARAVSWLRDNFARPFHSEELARQTDMAPSTFHSSSRNVCGFMRPSGSCWSKGKTRAARPSKLATKAFPCSTGNTSVSSGPRRGVTWSRRRAESSNPGGYGCRTERAAKPPVLCSRRGILTRIAHRPFRKARKRQKTSCFRPHRNLLPCNRAAPVRQKDFWRNPVFRRMLFPSR